MAADRVRLPPFLRVPIALAITTAFFYLTVEDFTLVNSLVCAIGFLMAGLFFVFSVLWWTGREDFTPVGHGGAPAPPRASPLVQRSIIPFSMLAVFAYASILVGLYSDADTSVLESPVGQVVLGVLILWFIASAAFGQPRALLPKVLRTREKHA